MRRAIIALAASAALAIPAISIAADPPSQQNKDNAAKFCKALRDASGRDNFRSMFGGGKNAFGKCVSKNAKKDQHQDQVAHDNAAKTCKAERAQDPAAFKDKYGTNKDKSNAYGKCVSQHAKQNKQQMDQQETQSATNAAKDCRAEKKQDPAAFKDKYGTNKNKSNAFGKCVSQKEHQQNSGDGGGTP
jgi:hypothetical protein